MYLNVRMYAFGLFVQQALCSPYDMHRVEWIDIQINDKKYGKKEKESEISVSERKSEKERVWTRYYLETKQKSNSWVR